MWQALIAAVEISSKTLVAKATILLGELLDMTKALLPSFFTARTQGLPKLFKLASDFENESLRHQATTVLNHIDSFHKRKQKQTTFTAEEKIVSQSVADGATDITGTDRTERQKETIKVKMGIQIDDLHFKIIMNETLVRYFFCFIL